MKNPVTSERGSALLVVLCLMGMLTLAGLYAVRTSNTDMDLAFNKVNSEQAFYIAEAGAKRGVAELIKDDAWNDGFVDMTFGSGTFTVVVADSTTDPALDDTVIVTSTGASRDAMATVEITIVPEYIYPFRHALFADDKVDIRNSMRTDSYNSDSGSYWSTQTNEDGDVGSNGVVEIKNGAIIGGDAFTSLTGGLTVNTGATVYGTTADDAPPETLSEIPTEEYDWALANTQVSTGITGSYTYDASTYAFETNSSVELKGGVYYFSSFTLLNSAALTVAPGEEVTIYVTGDIEIKNSGDVNPDGDPSAKTFFSQGDLILKNSGTIHGLFYAPDGTADLRNSSDFFGSIVANDIVAHSSAEFHYDRELEKIKKGKTGNLDLVAWKEI